MSNLSALKRTTGYGLDSSMNTTTVQPLHQKIREHCIGGEERFLGPEDQDIWWEIVTSIC